jgi:hypothetical protein
MRYRSALSLYGFVLALAFSASPAAAQYEKRDVSDLATGERYHIEGAIGLWNPSPDMTITSESLGIAGTPIDFQKDLGLTTERFGEFNVTLRPIRSQKLRFQYIPITYTQTATLDRTVVFNGQSYHIGAPVSSQLNWKAYRFTYEFDFVKWDRGYAGFVLDAKYTDVTARLQSGSTDEFAHARAPVPALGGTVRVYPTSNISITGELTGMKIPDSISKEYKGHYVDFDLYGTYNFLNNVGAQVGYRSFDVGYLVKKDTGSFTLKGLYFGVVARY